MAIKKDPKSGKWIAQVGSGDQGTRKRKRFPTKKEAEEWILGEQQRANLQKNHPTLNLNLKLSVLLDLFLLSLAETTKKHRYDIEIAVRDVSKFCEFSTIGDVNLEKVEVYKTTPVYSSERAFCRKKPISARTKNKKVKMFKAMLEFAVRSGFALENPLKYFKLSREKKSDRRCLNQQETIELLEAAKTNSPKTLYPIIFTLLYTGMRKAEALTLEWEDVDFERRLIMVKDKPHILINGEPFKCKWGSSRTLPLRRSLMELLMEQPKTSDLVFPSENGGLRNHNWNIRFSQAIRGAKIRNLHEITTHVLRHTFISQLIAYGKVDIKTVSVLAGHKDLKTTQIYLHLLSTSEDHIKAVESLPDY